MVPVRIEMALVCVQSRVVVPRRFVRLAQRHVSLFRLASTAPLKARVHRIDQGNSCVIRVIIASLVFGTVVHLARTPHPLSCSRRARIHVSRGTIARWVLQHQRCSAHHQQRTAPEAVRNPRT
jgi:hypothetical protein